MSSGKRPRLNDSQQSEGFAPLTGDAGCVAGGALLLVRVFVSSGPLSTLAGLVCLSLTQTAAVLPLRRSLNDARVEEKQKAEEQEQEDDEDDVVVFVAEVPAPAARPRPTPSSAAASLASRQHGVSPAAARAPATAPSRSPAAAYAPPPPGQPRGQANTRGGPTRAGVATANAPEAAGVGPSGTQP
jgi:hypothetical protein